MNDSTLSSRAQFDLLNMFSTELLGEAEPDESVVSLLMQDIAEADLPEFLFTVTVKGNLKLLHALQLHRGPLPLSYELKAGGRVSTVNGLSIKPQRRGVLSSCTRVAEVKSFFSIIKAQGFRGLVEPGPVIPYLFSDNKQTYDDVLGLVRSASFKGELPYLEAGTLKSPELAISLSEESFYSATPDVFMPILCWATESMVKEFSEALQPVRLLQHVQYERCRSSSVLKTLSSKPATLFKASVKPGDEFYVNEIMLGIGAGANQSEWVGNLHGYMGTELTKLGFGDPGGRILCETRVDFLLGFPAALCTEQNLLESKRFATEYFPLDILAIQTLKACTQVYGHPQQPYAKFVRSDAKTYRNPFSPLFEMMATDSEAGDRLLGMLTREQWLTIAKSAESDHLSSRALLALRDVFDLDNKGMILKLVPEDLDVLSKGGYQFAAGTGLLKGDYDSEDEPDPEFRFSGVRLDLSGYSISFTLEEDSAEAVLAEAIRLHGVAQSMNLWSSKKPKPETVKQALREIVEVNITNPSHEQAMALYAFLVSQGVAACAKEATSPEEWLRIVEMFSDQEVKPYLSIMPGRARGRALEQQLGL
jgi:hypothetical protein